MIAARAKERQREAGAVAASRPRDSSGKLQLGVNSSQAVKPERKPKATEKAAAVVNGYT